MSEPVDPRVRHVLFYAPGSHRQPGVDFRQEPVVMGHVERHRQPLERGKLEVGGPFLHADAGGMMVGVPEVSFEELDAFAAADPAVQAGQVRYEIRAWHSPMAQDA